MNKAAFHGPLGAVDRAQVGRRSLQSLVPRRRSDALHLSKSFDEVVERRVNILTESRNAPYAARYQALVEK